MKRNRSKRNETKRSEKIYEKFNMAWRPRGFIQCRQEQYQHRCQFPVWLCPTIPSRKIRCWSQNHSAHLIAKYIYPLLPQYCRDRSLETLHFQDHHHEKYIFLIFSSRKHCQLKLLLKQTSTLGSTLRQHQTKIGTQPIQRKSRLLLAWNFHILFQIKLSTQWYAFCYFFPMFFN
jgi:hypothetical protein